MLLLALIAGLVWYMPLASTLAMLAGAVVGFGLHTNAFSQNKRVGVRPIVTSVYTIGKGYTLSQYRRLKEYLRGSVKPIGNGLYEVTFCIEGSEFKLVTSKRNGPSPILVATSGERDVTTLVHTYLGPERTYRVTPRTMGLDTVQLHLTSGEEKEFKESDLITV
jgi:hypothetical protein